MGPEESLSEENLLEENLKDKKLIEEGSPSVSTDLQEEEDKSLEQSSSLVLADSPIESPIESEIVAAQFVEPDYALPDSFINIPESEQNKTKEETSLSTEVYAEESVTAKTEIEVESSVPQVNDETPEKDQLDQVKEEEFTEEI